MADPKPGYFAVACELKELDAICSEGVYVAPEARLAAIAEIDELLELLGAHLSNSGQHIVIERRRRPRNT